LNASGNQSDPRTEANGNHSQLSISGVVRWRAKRIVFYASLPFSKWLRHVVALVTSARAPAGTVPWPAASCTLECEAGKPPERAERAFVMAADEVIPDRWRLLRRRAYGVSAQDVGATGIEAATLGLNGS
jgi:hypothetical protein